MKVLKNSLILLLLAASFFIASSVSAYSQTPPAYLIVHCHNPEGIEINSIAGIMYTENEAQISVSDGHSWAAPKNSAEHNQAHQVSAGNLTVTATFNGMSLQQNVNLSENETKALYFTFTRMAEISNTYLLTGSNHVQKSGSYYVPPWHQNWVVGFGEIINNVWLTGFAGCYIEGGEATTNIEVQGSFECSPTLISFNLNGTFSITGNANPHINIASMGIGTNPPAFPKIIVSIPSHSDFTNWFMQNMIGQPQEFDVKLINVQGFGEMLIKGGETGFITHPMPASINYIATEIQKGFAKTSGEGQWTSLSLSDNKDYFIGGENLKFSSVPYDIMGTGVGDEQILLLAEAKTDKPSYAIGETVKISSKVTDSSGLAVSGASVTAEILKPDGTTEIIPLSESPPGSGTYQGTFTNTTMPGSYKVTLIATKPGYASAQVILNFGVNPNPPQQLGKPQDPTVAVRKDPINVTNGNLFSTHQDIFIPGRELPLELVRTYNSQATNPGALGYGWMHNYIVNLIKNPDGSLMLVEEDGRRLRFTPLSPTTFKSPKGNYDQLTKNPDGSYTLLRKHGRKLYFDTYRGALVLVKIEERNGNAINISRAPTGAIREVSDSSGRKLLFGYAQGKIYGIMDPQGRIFRYEYDSSGNLIKVIDPLNQETRYEYDQNHNLIQITDANGHSLYFEYDSFDRVSHSWQDDNNNELTLSYDADNKITTVLDSRGNATKYKYNKDGLNTKITDSQNKTQVFVWDENLNKISSIDQNNNTTNFTYDARGNLLTVKDPLNNTTSFSYEPDFDFVSSITDALGNITAYTYDNRGNLTQVKDALNNTTDYIYNPLGQLIQVKDANNNITNFTYDIYGNLTQAVDSLNNSTSFTYDILGNLIQTTDARNNSTQFSYDLLNRLIQITYPDNSIATRTYDPVGNLLTSTDPNNQTTSYIYDAVNRLVTVIDPAGNTTQYAYDTEGNRTSITDAKGNSTTYFYDSLNRLTRTLDSLDNQTLFNYDPAGNLIAKTDANGNTTYYTYDALNRLSEKGLSPKGTVPDSLVFYTYDARGNMLNAANANISYNFTYNALGKLTRVTDSHNRSLSYVYDPVGNKLKMTTPEGKTVSYSYDALNRLVSILDIYSKSTNYTYDSLGRRTKATLPNSTTASYAYDTLSRLLSLANQTSSGSIISSYTYTYDKASNRLTKTEPDLKTSYAYDALYRLTQSTPLKLKNNGEEKEKKSQLEIYTYDPLGNRLTSKKDTYSYNSLNQLLTTKDYAYEYDKNGNLIKKSIAEEDDKPKTYTYTYDYENRLTKVEIKKENKLRIAIFTYDPFNRRISKTIQRQKIEDQDNDNNNEEDSDDSAVPRTTTYVYDNEDIILEYNQKAKITARYTHGPGIDEPISIERKNKVYYYHYDGLGSVTELTDQKQKTVETYSYDSFGNLKRQGNKTKNPYTYTGREYDKETGLYYYRARYYVPKIGRFLTQDPIGMITGPNLYTYCNNNPVNFVDPWGLDKQKKDKPWWPWWSEVFIPGYGRYGGPFRTDPTFQTRPEDSMDRLFMMHDIGWSQGQGKEVDRRILTELYNLPSNPKDWEEPPQSSWKATTYRRFVAEPYFWWRNRLLESKNDNE